MQPRAGRFIRLSQPFMENEMIIRQYFVGGIAHSSYLLGGKNTCAMVDPQRDRRVYLEAAEELELTITHVLETHLHADFVSGHMTWRR